jgi:adenine-specific DNA-methyltransferase
VIPGGLIALLTPTSYFSGPTYEKIRALYSKRSSILRIDLIHERENLFLGVEHDVAALLARPRLTHPARQVPEIFCWRETKGWESLGSILLSGDARPWLLPRDSSTSEALIRARTSTWSLANYGYRARVGVYVWNRDERRPRKARPSGRDRKNAVPVIWATQIGQDGSFRFISKSAKEKRARYILLRSNDRRGVVESDCVVLQRTSSRGQSRRLVAAALPKGFAKQYGGFVGENHVIILEPTDKKPLVPRIALARLLNSEFMRDLYSTTTGTTAVTVSGLNVLPLPDPHSVARLVEKCGMEQAIRGAFGLKRDYQRTVKADAKIATT